MNERLLLRIVLAWCLVLTLWGSYFTWRFIDHEKESLGRSAEIHSTLIEVREILAEQKQLLKQSKK